MTEPTITCPNCKTEIKLTESLAAPLIAATRKQFEQQLAQKDSDIAQREQATREKEKQLVEAKNKLDEQVADQVAEQLKKDRTRIAAEEAKKAKQAAATDLEQKAQELSELQEVLKQRNEKLAEAQKAQAELIKKQRELDDAKRELELTVEKRVQEGLDATRQQAKKEAEDEQKFKVMEKEQTIAAMQKQIEDLKRRAEQGSQQLQGEVQELELENLLRTKFPFDAIEPVPKGEFGGDVLHRVVGTGGQFGGIERKFGAQQVFQFQFLHFTLQLLRALFGAALEVFDLLLHCGNGLLLLHYLEFLFVLGFFFGLLAGSVKSFLHAFFNGEFQFAFGIVQLALFFDQFGLRFLRLG